MRYLIAALLVLVPVMAFAANATDVNLAWDAVTNADSYIIEMSTDQGQTWVETRNSTDSSMIWTNAPDTGLLLFRASAVRGDKKATRTEYGAWFNGAWDLDEPAGMGIH